MAEVGCWAHARRHFQPMLEKDQARMGGVPVMDAHLRSERVARQNGLRGEELSQAREHGARPVLHQLHAYPLTIREQALPKSEAGQAIGYTAK